MSCSYFQVDFHTEIRYGTAVNRHAINLVIRKIVQKFVYEESQVGIFGNAFLHAQIQVTRKRYNFAAEPGLRCKKRQAIADMGLAYILRCTA